MRGTLFFVVGPSGIGKDTLLRGARERLATESRFVFARRSITRPPDVGDEGHISLTAEDFTKLRASKSFLIDWTAHGLHYGIAREIEEELKLGHHVIVNGSRAAVPELIQTVTNVVVIDIVASREAIERRLLSRGRDGAGEIRARLERVTPPYPEGATVVVIHNDRDVGSGIAELVAALEKFSSRRPSSIESHLNALTRAKVDGEVLSEDDYRSALGAIVRGDCSRAEAQSFLIATANALSIEEVTAITKVRSEFADRIKWREPLIVDKHSLGGVPGSRITLIVVPIVAAHGLAMPKASSRAITSAAGTADAMETVARVDLTLGEVMTTVAAARGCIVWNGRLNHSSLDDVINAITRPMGLNAARWSVASILSKKITAGVTHLVVDLPYGRYTKLKSLAEAEELANLFTAVGGEVGLTVQTKISQGHEPVGRGIGPALEVRDVLDVLNNRVGAPVDLKAKALSFAATVLSWAPDISSEGEAQRRAAELLASGAARSAFDRIVEMQGRRDPPIVPGSLHKVVASTHSGVVSQINGWTIASIARMGGAPGDPSAGIDLQVKTGDEIRAGDVLYEIRANDQTALETAFALARADPGIDVR